MRIAIAQINATVGDIAGNLERIADYAARARAGGADVLVTPELAICGYPPEDLLLRADFMSACAQALHELTRRVHGITMLVGHPRMSAGARYNSASVIRDGRVLCVYDKHNLPNYTVFDEARYFDPADEPCVFTTNGVRLAVNICEDTWSRGEEVPAHEAGLAINICADTWDAEAPRAARELGARILLVPNASPYHLNKQEVRYRVMRERVRETALAIVYVNLVGGQDELVFDGASFVMDAGGTVVRQLPAFEEALGFVDTRDGVPVQGALAQRPVVEAEVYSALTLAVRDYVRKNGFPGVLLGVSGGVDSALTLAIAADAVGAERTRAIMMPSRHTSDMSREDARALSTALGVRYSEIPIGRVFEASLDTLSAELDAARAGIAEENLQSRIRGTLLMAISNKTGALVLTAGNKSEMATGYTALYGDMAGGFAVLKDIDKTLVYRLARYRNSLSKVIPERVLTRPPSAELRPGQSDRDSLPAYRDLDAILEAYVEDDISPSDIVARGFSRHDVARVVHMVRASEFKRRQAPIGPRITTRAFGKDWRYPVTNAFRPA